MKGNPVNIHNIKDSVKQEFDTVRKNMKLWMAVDHKTFYCKL
jgi:hypothetical protein